MKTCARILVIFLIAIAGAANVFAQGEDHNLKTSVEKLKNYIGTHPSEKAYLQFDKPYYAAGDTVYFKAYLTIGERHVPSRLSGVLHADLVNTKNTIDQSIKLQVTDGVAWGDFALPDSLPPGTYRVRAWTRWMRNDPGSFFEKDIAVGSLRNDKVPESNTAKAVNAKADLQFFPEGGEMVSGIENKIAFKAIGTNGMGIDVKGTITDNTGKQVAEFASARLGMGYFELTPEGGKSYKAEVIYADGAKDEVMLPQARDKGITLSVNNDSLQKVTVTVKANQYYFSENMGKEYTLLIYSGGIATTVNCKLDSSVISVDLIKRKLFTGVTRITLFSPQNEPLCERLIFIQNYDQLSLDIKTDKETYHARDKVSVKLNIKTRADSAATGHFSVSVVDESKVPPDENNETTILSTLLLTSDLKGCVQQPNYYFNNINDEKLKELDLVMLTHGYRRFTWKQVLDTMNNKPVYQPETGLEISGQATTLLGKPVVKGTVSLISPTGGPILSQTTDDKGNFRFSNLIFNDSTRFVLNATNAKGKNSTKLTYNKDITPPAGNSITPKHSNFGRGMNDYLINSEKQQEQLNALDLGKGRVLKEVKINAKKIEKISTGTRYGLSNQTITGDQVPFSGNALAVRLMTVVKLVDWYNVNGNVFIPMLPRNKVLGAGPMTIVWNDTEMPRGFDINQIRAPIERIEVIRDNGAYPQGVMLIYTGGGLQLRGVIAAGVLPITVKGFYKAREFYSPKYEHPNDYANSKDLRSTIYWQPELKTDKDGNAAFEYYNADGTGTCKVTIEGMDNKGNIGRQVFRYKVE